jgi:hypothetical protein
MFYVRFFHGETKTGYILGADYTLGADYNLGAGRVYQVKSFKLQ